MLKKIAITILGTVGLLGLFLIIRALSLPSPGPTIPITTPDIGLETREKLINDLSDAIRIQTISTQAGTPDQAAFKNFRDLLAQKYPNVHRVMRRETIADHSLLFHWPAQTSSSQKGVLFMAHMDVVPVEPGTDDTWEHPPYAGILADGYVWGRGANDNKGQLIALMQAAERLVEAGFAPTRDFYFAFGHDEELGGTNGAGEIGKHLRAQGVSLSWTLDEGSVITQGILPGVENPVALIALAEKGITSLRLTASAPGGHSSAPGADTAASILARAIVKISDHPYPLRIDESSKNALELVAINAPFGQKIALANLWLFGPMVADQLAQDPAIAATMHTTTAPTIIRSGTKTNVLPQHAEAFINYRIHPRDSIQSVTERARKLVDDDRVTITSVGGNEPSPISTIKPDGYGHLVSATQEIFGDIPIVPSLMIAGTDSRHYYEITDASYRFAPVIFGPDDIGRLHGTNERIAVDDLIRMTLYYEALIKQASK